MKSGIVIIAELMGDVGARVLEIQERHDPRMAAELPPHITLVGSSGMGPIPMRTTLETLRDALEPITSTTAPIELHFGAPTRFMQTNIVVLPLDPHGPLRALHERIKQSGLSYEPPRFPFTPHCTLNFYPELTRERLRELMSVRISDPVCLDRIECYRTVDLTRTSKILELPLVGS